MEIGSSTAQIWHREQYNDRDDEREVEAMSSSKLSEMTAEERAKVYGWVNGTPVYSRDEFVFKRRGFGAIESDEELIEFARKVTGNWYNAGWNKTFTTYYLGDYCLNEPMRSLTTKESAVSIPANGDTEISARNFAHRSYEAERQELLNRRVALLKIRANL